MLPKVTQLKLEDISKTFSLKANETLISVKTERNSGVGIVGILAFPKSLLADDLFRSEFYLPTHKCALLLHGHMGHKNYCYQEMLADELACKGMYSFRLDFRGLGDSEDSDDPAKGRTVDQDVVDIGVAIEFLRNGSKYEIPNFVDLEIDSIIAHSRGAVAMFKYAILQEDKRKRGEQYQKVYNLVNCSSRFRGLGLYESVMKKNPEWLATEHYVTCYRNGAYQKVLIPHFETLDLAAQQISRIEELSPDISVLSVYGSHDHIIPITDMTYFANLLGGRHTLEVVPYADHNFYGSDLVDQDSEEYNPRHWPKKRGKINFNYEVTEIVSKWLDTDAQAARFYKYHGDLKVDGISNFRDLGGYPSCFRKDNHELVVKPGVLFRCANPARVTETGATKLKELGVSKVFDLRGEIEAQHNGIINVEGIKVECASFDRGRDLSPQNIVSTYHNFLSSWYNFPQAYISILRNSTNEIRGFFRYLLEANKPVIFNCAAGKDRTGILAMLCLLVLGVSNDTIAREYQITTFGLLSELPQFDGAMSRVFSKLDVGPFIKEYNTSEEQMAATLMSSKYEAMRRMIDVFNEEYGSAQYYFETVLKFSTAEVDQLRKQLLVPA